MRSAEENIRRGNSEVPRLSISWHRPSGAAGVLAPSAGTVAILNCPPMGGQTPPGKLTYHIGVAVISDRTGHVPTLAPCCLPLPRRTAQRRFLHQGRRPQ